MPATDRALARTARARAKATSKPYSAARVDVLAIRDVAAGNGLTYADAEAEYDDPRNQPLCDKCGWTVGMVCPECPGCGCYNRTCSGWRHAEYMHPDEARELAECDECGGDTRNHYSCHCGEECPDCGVWDANGSCACTDDD